MAKRASSRPAKRKKAAKKAARRAAPKPRRAPRRPPPPRPDLVSTRRDGLPDVLFVLPGYDPTLTAGGAWFDVDAAARYLDFWEECLTHVEGALAGSPFILERWQVSVLANLYGWKRRDELGREVRRFRTVFLYVPRKNGKTPMAAGIALTCWVLDEEPAAEIYSAAADRKQAALVYKHASGMCRNEPELASRIRPYGEKGEGYGHRALVWEGAHSSYQVLSADAETKHGLTPHCALIDELHAHKKPDLAAALRTAFVSLNRVQPVLAYFTTADYDRVSICNDIYKVACAVRDNPGDPAKPGFDGSFLPVIYEAGPEDDWTDEATWRKANPNLGVSVSVEALRQACREAQENPALQNEFRRLHVNQKTGQAKRWIDMTEWDACAGETDLEALAGRVCMGALDLSSTDDTTSWGLLFPPQDEDDVYRYLVRIWVPAARIEERARAQAVPYDVWERMGVLEPTHGDVVDYRFIRAAINEDAKKYKIARIGYDPWNATQIALDLQDEDGFEMVEYRQGYKSMNEPTKELGRLIKLQRLAHGGHPVLRWMASNVALAIDPTGNVKPNKETSGDKIDGMVTLIMSLGLWLASPRKRGSKYEGEGLLVI